MAICKNCNSLVSDTATFCQNCGASLNNQNSTNEVNNIVQNTPVTANNETQLHQNTILTVNKYFSEVLNQPLPDNDDTKVNLEDILIKTNSADKYIHNFPYFFGLFFGCLIVLFFGSAILDSIFSIQILNSNSSGSGGLLTLAIMLIIAIIVSVLLFLFLINKRANLRFSFKNNIQTYQYLRKIIVDNNLYVYRSTIHSVILSAGNVLKNVGQNQSFDQALVNSHRDIIVGHQIGIIFSHQKIVVSGEGVAFKKLIPGLMELENEYI